MSGNKSQPGEPAKILVLADGAARKICEKHGHKEAAQKIVDELPNRASLNSTEVAALVQDQILYFAQSLVNSVKRANEAARKVEMLPQRAAQGAALREIRDALESLRDAVEHNWELAGPFLEIETAEQLGRLLTTEATRELLPARLRSEYIKASSNKAKYKQQRLNLSFRVDAGRLNRSFLLKAGSQPMTRLIRGAKITVRRAEMSIRPGPPLKDPLRLALILQLAQHFEGILRKKATRTARGPFERFCEDVFVSLGLETEPSWEYLLKNGLKHHRSSFVARRDHEQHDDPKNEGGQSKGRKPRKKQLAPLMKRKTSPNQ